MSSTLVSFARNGSSRLSARFEKEFQKIRAGDRRSEPLKSKTDVSEPSLETKHLTVPLLQNGEPEISLVELHQNDVIPERSCVICLGSTGAGKSSTITKYTHQNAKSSSGTHRETKKCAIYRKMSDEESPVWVDTVGWDDADCEDEDSFKDVLRFIDSNEITSVKAIIWNVIPNVRLDALLSQQAALINHFKPVEIWDNVIIIIKQSMNPEVDGKGAIMAALKYNTLSKIQICGYRFYKDPTITEDQRESLQSPATRRVFNVKTDEEIRCLLQEKLDNIGSPIQVVFKDSKCIDCGQIGDVRLLDSYCHMEMSRIHSGHVESFHPRKTEAFHPNDNIVAQHDGFLRKPWYSFPCALKATERYSCCHKKSGKPGCSEKWACCYTPIDSQRGYGCQQRYACCKKEKKKNERNDEGCKARYSCCKRKTSSEGCKKICKKCNQLWGTESKNCFKVQAHNIKELSYVEKESLLDEDEICQEDEEEKMEKQVIGKEMKEEIKLEFCDNPVIVYHVL